jgi:glutathione synthase/RimK-type ligase-like ATP-grasp enzyme
MGENGIPVAEVYHTPPQDESLYPLVGRGRINHKAGADIKIVEAPAEARESGCKYFLSFFEADRELRVHVVNGEAVKGFRKVPREDDAHKKIRTSKFGWGYKRVNLEKYYPKCAETAVKAVEALGLIYGGVDIARNRQGEVLVFEVNTGPALNIKTVTYYTDLFAKHLQGLNAEGVIEYESPQ